VDEAVFYREEGGEIFIRAKGHMTAALCPELKARAFARLDTLPPITSVFFDLGPCEYMDSTFLGLIVGLNKRFKAKTGRTVVLLRVNQTCLGLLRTIGVLKLITVSEEDRAFPDEMESLGQKRAATAEFLLDSHEELSELSEENRARFSTLTKALKDSLKKDGP
jgi:anti-anti-sigma factor